VVLAAGRSVPIGLNTRSNRRPAGAYAENENVDHDWHSTVSSIQAITIGHTVTSNRSKLTVLVHRTLPERDLTGPGSFGLPILERSAV
jgi:hypothetical protein